MVAMTDTLAAPASHLLEVRHSRFLARAAAAQAPAQAMEFIAHASDPDASHNCWAWRVGQDYRSSDDGEPAGTAGRPILAAIDGQGVALGTTSLVADDLASGRLVRPFDLALKGPPQFAYYLVAPRATADRPLVKAFRDWVLAETGR